MDITILIYWVSNLTLHDDGLICLLRPATVAACEPPAARHSHSHRLNKTKDPPAVCKHSMETEGLARYISDHYHLLSYFDWFNRHQGWTKTSNWEHLHWSMCTICVGTGLRQFCLRRNKGQEQRMAAIPRPIWWAMIIIKHRLLFEISQTSDRKREEMIWKIFFTFDFHILP